MLQEDLQKLFHRDLNKLKTEIELYPNEQAIWVTGGQITNSAGNLCLHIIGNLNTYIGAQLGGSGYVRQRDLEFSLKDVPRAELIKKIEDTIKVIDTTVSTLTDQQLDMEYPIMVFENKTSTAYFLIHLAGHLTYHLGQINYHRRLLAI